jgi:hypothetical protein
MLDVAAGCVGLQGAQNGDLDYGIAGKPMNTPFFRVLMR